MKQAPRPKTLERCLTGLSMALRRQKGEANNIPRQFCQLYIRNRTRAGVLLESVYNADQTL